MRGSRGPRAVRRPGTDVVLARCMLDMTARARSRSRLALALSTVGLGLAATTLSPPARACSPAEETTGVTDGLGGASVKEVPRNYAYLQDKTGRVALAAGGLPLYRDRVSLLPGPHPSLDGVKVLDRVDATAPDKPRLRGGVMRVTPPGDGCFANETRSLALDLEVPTKDDQTPETLITYAIYAGGTRQGAETAPSPVAYRVPGAESVGILYSAPDARWFSVAPIDLAGNVGPRSEAVEVAVDSGGGCSTSRSRGGVPATLAIGLAVVAALGRRRRRVR